METEHMMMSLTDACEVWTQTSRPGNMAVMNDRNTGISDRAAPDMVSHDPYIIDRARAGDREAFNTLARLHHGEIYRMVYYRTRSRMDAEDITQDVFMKAFRMIGDLRDGSRFRSWLFAIAVNKVRDFQRKRKLLAFLGFGKPGDETDVAEEIPDRGQNSLDDVMRRDFWGQVGMFVDSLPRMEREVFVLRFMDDLSIREITRSLGKSESTVKTHLYRAVAKFRSHASLIQLLDGGAQ